ncbi:MAG: peptidylprolyl isomerase [Acidimicrobiales bacterium]
MNRLAAVLVAGALALAGCGVSRDASSAAPVTSLSPDGSGTEGSNDTGPTPTTVPPTPATTAPADDIAATITFADGSTMELLHGPTNEIAASTEANQTFVDLVYGGTMPPTFTDVVLSQRIIGAFLEHDNEVAGVEVTDEDRTEAEDLLISGLAPLIAAGDPAADAEVEARGYVADVAYLPFLLSIQSSQIALSRTLAATSEAQGDPCVRHILVDTEAEADEVLAALNGGADFATLAAERSIDPSAATNGGDLGCAPSSMYVAPFATAVDGAAEGAYLEPVQTDFGWHVIIVDGYEVDGTAMAQEQLAASVAGATVEVDPRVGVWDPQMGAVVPAEG